MDHVFAHIYCRGVCFVLGMDGSCTSPTAQLLAANRRLHQLRAAVQAQRQAVAGGHPAGQPRPGAVPQNAGHPAPGVLPPSVGWGSQPLTAVLRRSAPAVTQDEGPAGTPPWRDLASTRPGTPPSAGAPDPAGEDWVKLYPDIGLGLLRQGLTAPGRLWLLLRFLDREGRGALRIDIIEQQLTSKSSTHYLCSKRQLRNLLPAGEGIFWVRDRRDRRQLWLRSAARVAHALAIPRLSGRPVALPLTALLGGIGAFRAHLYAAFHSGRGRTAAAATATAGEAARPIARATLARLSGVGRSSQRAYEARLGLPVQAHFAVGEVADPAGQQASAWRHGQALFLFKDHRGRQGRRGATYLAWQLPNSYRGLHAQQPQGRQKRINRQLKDLVMQGMPGNVEAAGDLSRPGRAYYPNGKLAAKAFNRDPQGEVYWPQSQPRRGRFVLWQRLGGGG